MRESAQGSCALPCVKTCADVAAVRLSRSALRTLPCAWLRIAVANTAVAKTSLCCPWAPPCMGDSELADSDWVGGNSLLVLPQPIKGKDYRKQGPAGTADKPYTMPKVKQDGPPPGGFGPIKTKRFVGVTTSIPSSV